MRLYKGFLISLSLLSLFACSKEESVKWQLREQVLSYYRDSVPNRDKYRAALFLLEKWETQEDLDAHFATESFAKLQELKAVYCDNVELQKFVTE